MILVASKKFPFFAAIFWFVKPSHGELFLHTWFRGLFIGVRTPHEISASVYDVKLKLRSAIKLDKRNMINR